MTDFRPYPPPAATAFSGDVSDTDRARAMQWLHDAYADGRLGPAELNARVGSVVAARSRAEMEGAFVGLVPGSPGVGLVPASVAAGSYREPPSPALPGVDQTSRTLGALAHGSFFFSWLVGPALLYLTARPGSYVRTQAARSFNFQLVMMIAAVALRILDGAVFASHLGWLLGLLTLAWFLLTIVGAVKAWHGEDWKNPVTRLVNLQVLRERA